MDLDIVALMTRPGTYVLAVVIFIATFFVRRIVELQWPSIKKQADANAPEATYLTKMARWWNEVILYALPVLFGMAFGIYQSEFLFGNVGDKGGRLLFGAVVGWFASFLYKLLQRVIKQKTGVDIAPDASSFRPPPDSPPPLPPGAA